MSRRYLFLMAIVVVAVGLCLPAAGAQQRGKKEFQFRGKVVSVDAKAKRLNVANEAIPGWMGAMTMGYAVDKPDDVIKRVKAGDQITAKVYEDDYRLYDVQVVPPKK